MQLEMLSGFYHCDNCGQTVNSVRRARRWWLCDACWSAIMPPWDQVQLAGHEHRSPAWYAETSEQRDAINRYWMWVEGMERRDPAPPRRFHSVPMSMVTPDDLWPLCACGAQREPMLYKGEGGLFGGPFRRHCPACDARLTIETLWNMGQHTHPEWDDEDWMEYMWKVYPQYFEIGVLPDHWYRLRQQYR